jgi:hypothetical protein
MQERNLAMFKMMTIFVLGLVANLSFGRWATFINKPKQARLSRYKRLHVEPLELR